MNEHEEDGVETALAVGVALLLVYAALCYAADVLSPWIAVGGYGW